MKSVLRPMDVVLAHPDTLSKIVPRNELDHRLLETLSWGFALHPEEIDRTKKLEVSDVVVIDWTEKEGFEDVRDFVCNSTVFNDLPVAGLAEHTISLRRLVNAQDKIVREGEAWAYGTATHLRNMLENN